MPPPPGAAHSQRVRTLRDGAAEFELAAEEAAVGCTVVTCGLQKRPELNGSTGTVVGVQADRLVVALASGARQAFKPGNLRLTAPPQQQPGAASPRSPQAASPPPRSPPAAVSPGPPEEASPEVEELRQLGNGAFKDGDHTAARAAYTEALRLCPSDPRLWCNRAAVYLATAAPGQAAADAAEAAALAPQWAKAHWRLGQALRELGRTAEARQSFSRAAALAPDAAEFQSALASCPRTQPRGTACLLTWGRGDSGCLGAGDRSSRTLPRGIDALRGVRITDIACGMNFCVAATGAGDCLAWGANDRGQCGGGDIAEVLHPAPVRGLPPCVVAVAAGGGHCVAVTAAGDVWAWGANGQGQLGVGDEEPHEYPVKVPGFDGRCQGICCGLGHTVALDKNSGELWGWGWNHTGQLGVEGRANVLAPRRLQLPLPDGEVGRVTHCSAGGGHTVAVTAGGSAYAVGSNACGQLGLGHCDNTDSWQRIPLELEQEEGAVLAACGEEFTVIVTDRGRAQAAGIGIVGQLGDGELSPTRALFRAVSLPHAIRVQLIACTQTEVVALDSSGRAWGWGLPGSAPGGNTNAAACSATPQPLESLSRKSLRRLECGRRHYAAVCDSPMPSASSVSGVADRVAGKRSRYCVTARGADAGAWPKGGEVVTASHLLHSSGALCFVDDGDVMDNGDGTYEVPVKLNVAGRYTARVFLMGEEVPVPNGGVFTVRPALPKPSICHAEEWAPSATASGALPAGAQLFLTLPLTDRFGNPIIDQDPELVTVTVGGEEPPVVSRTAQNCGPGGVMVAFSWHQIGTHQVRVRYDADDIDGPGEIASSPFQLEVVGGAPRAAPILRRRIALPPGRGCAPRAPRRRAPSASRRATSTGTPPLRPRSTSPPRCSPQAAAGVCCSAPSRGWRARARRKCGPTPPSTAGSTRCTSGPPLRGRRRSRSPAAPSPSPWYRAWRRCARPWRACRRRRSGGACTSRGSSTRTGSGFGRRCARPSAPCSSSRRKRTSGRYSYARRRRPSAAPLRPWPKSSSAGRRSGSAGSAPRSAPAAVSSSSLPGGTMGRRRPCRGGRVRQRPALAQSLWRYRTHESRARILANARRVRKSRL
eukprot:TRINITY_DN19562_c0_g1_i1.p1 TRINITY_DN19562_c0_g1~~TRINITY_DN19562_c0_g1_i1.p1  ORF type:complete len:1129 (+),score=139.22 TRINITY_DN19562_c0_g1_i1:80-3388(+)